MENTIGQLYKFWISKTAAGYMIFCQSNSNEFQNKNAQLVDNAFLFQETPAQIPLSQTYFKLLHWGICYWNDHCFRSDL